MAFAPHHNGELFNGAGEQVKPRILGQFREADGGHTFEFAERLPGMFPADFGTDCDHVVYVGNGEPRLARVLKTVAYIVVDERPDGSASYEKWDIRGHRLFA
jgi:hypothetical protein